MSPVVDHTDDSKEESRHHPVGEHLHTRAGQAVLIERGKAEHHQPHMRNR